MEKRLISLMLAGAMLTGVGAVAGCQSTENGQVSGDFGHIRQSNVEDAIIVVRLNDKDIAHKGDAKMVVSNSFNYASAGDYEYTFDCGLKTISSAKHSFYEALPDAELKLYDELCEECFNTAE